MTNQIKIRCSSLPRLALCPGSLKACEGLESKDSAQSLAGTAGHKALEQYYSQMRLEQAPFKQPIDAFLDGLDDMIAGRCRWYAKVIDELIAQHGGEVKIKTEWVLESTDLKLSGTIDLFVECADGCLLVVDYKFNWLEVPRAAQNLQLMGYAVILSKLHKYASRDITVILSAGGNDEPFTATVYNQMALKRAEHEIWRICTATDIEARQRNPSEDACKYCPAKCTTRCPETLSEIGNSKFEISVRDNLLPESKQDVADLWKQASFLTKLCEAFKDRVKEAVRENPEEWAEFFTLQNGGKTRTIQNAQKAYEAIVENNKLITTEEFLALVNLPISSLEKAVKPALLEKGFKVKDIKPLVEEMLGDNLFFEARADTVKAVGK